MYYYCEDCKEIYPDCSTRIHCCETCGEYYCEYCVTEDSPDKYTLVLEHVYYGYEEEDDFYLLVMCPKCDPFLHMTDKYELT